jgi:acetamidase/formamidase
LPGVDLILPDIRYLVEERKNLTGLVLTHAHEDHFGALIDLWPRLKVPIYATPFTAALPLDPMHGTVGVAPAGGEARSSLVPDAHGGNMDTPEMRAGTTCYLGVNVEGALFSLGDGHCRQGEGETCGVAVEAAMDTVLVVELIKGRLTPWPRLETADHIISTGSARPLEDAFRIAHGDLVMWLVQEFGLDKLDAYQLVSQIAESPVANVCDPNYTFVAKAPKRHLPSPDVYGSTREALEEVAAAYRAERGTA